MPEPISNAARRTRVRTDYTCDQGLHHIPRRRIATSHEQFIIFFQSFSSRLLTARGRFFKFLPAFLFLTSVFIFMPTLAAVRLGVSGPREHTAHVTAEFIAPLAQQRALTSHRPPARHKPTSSLWRKLQAKSRLLVPSQGERKAVGSSQSVSK